jgi:Domain of unknown function (DUF4037)
MGGGGTFEASLELNAAFYREVVEPLVRHVPHAAALLGWGSDVLGYDTARSTDHGWGPRLQVFVDADAVSDVRAAVEVGLPERFRGWAVSYPSGTDQGDDPAVHRVDVTTLGQWLTERLAVDPRAGLHDIDWLLIPQQALLGVVGGRVYADPAGELAAVREALAWYPRDVWLWLLACGWRRLDQEEPFVGRAAEVGDELGSRIVAARQVREVMRQAFLLQRTYAPYSKWLGTAFARLPCAPELAPPLSRALDAATHAGREAALVEAYELLGALHNRVAPTAHVDPAARFFYERPFRVLGAGRFVDACLEEVRDSRLRELPSVGSVDQFVDSTDVLAYPARAALLRALYQPID